MSKTYFLASTRDTVPTGPIFLGSIIKSPRSPELCLNSKHSPLLTTLDISTHIQKDSSRQLLRNSSGKAGIWAEFIDGIGIGGEVSGNWENIDIANYKFKELITKTISPSYGEIVQFFNDEGVQQAIKDSLWRANLYMVTGIKIARGADVVIERVRAQGGNLHFGVDLLPVGVPLKVGPDLKGQASVKEVITEKHEEEFVWAYRLREIRYRKKKIVDQKEYKKGDLMGKGPLTEEERAERARKRKADELEGEVELVGLKEDDVEGDVLGIDADEVLDDDGQEVNLVKLDDDDDDDDN